MKIKFNFAIYLFVSIVALLAICTVPVFAQTTGGEPGPVAQSPFSSFFEMIAQAFGSQIITILALTGAQVLLAVALALRNKTFEWQKLADFFGTIILPKLIGWLACVILARFVIADTLPPNLLIISQGIEATAFGAVVLALGGAILANLQALEILPARVSTVLTKIGIPEKEQDE